jgi:hypothetical protein
MSSDAHRLIHLLAFSFLSDATPVLYIDLIELDGVVGADKLILILC